MQSFLIVAKNKDLTSSYTANLLKEKQAEDIFVFCGGVIPDDDIITLKKMGVREVFTPGTADKVIIEKVTALFADSSNESE